MEKEIAYHVRARVCECVCVCVCVCGGEIPSVEQQTKSSEIHTLLKTFLKGRTEEVGGGVRGCRQRQRDRGRGRINNN